MGIFSRLSDIVAANVNALLDKAENPEVLIAQIIREMEDGLAGARRAAATAIAAERQLARELEQHRAESARWKAKARDALSIGREDLARRALARKREHDDLVASLEEQTAAAHRTSESVRTSLRALEARLAEARRKQRTLLARHRAAQAKAQLLRAGSCIPGPGTAAAKVERMESRLNAYEDELLAQSDVENVFGGIEDEFSALEAKQEIDKELEELKREVGS